MLPKEVKKVIHERVVLDRNKCPRFINLEDYFSNAFNTDTRIINIIRYKAGCVIKYDSYAILGISLVSPKCTNKNQVIMTYLPSKNVVIIVER